MAKSSDVTMKIDAEEFLAATEKLGRSLRMLGIAGEAISEVKRAHEKHGTNADLADGVGINLSIIGSLVKHGGLEAPNLDLESYPSNYELELAQQKVNDDACADGRKHTRLGIMLEELLEAAAAEDIVELRTELIQAVAMGIDWIADLDSRTELI